MRRAVFRVHTEKQMAALGAAFCQLVIAGETLLLSGYVARMLASSPHLLTAPWGLESLYSAGDLYAAS